MAHAHPWRRRSRHLALAAGFGIIALSVPPWHAVLASIPPAGNRQLSIQVNTTQNQQANGSTGWNSAFTAGQGEGLQFESVSVNWNDLEPSSAPPNYSLIDTIYNYYEPLGVPIELRINSIYTCSREVPSDLMSYAWDDSTMINRFEAIIQGVYDHLHPAGKTPETLEYLSLGTEVDSALQYGWNQTSNINYYTKYKTFFESARTYAQDSSRFGSGLKVGLSATWDGLTSTTSESSSQNTYTANSGQNVLGFSTLPASFVVGDYFTVDYNGLNPETKKITAIDTNAKTWTLDSNLAHTHNAGYWAIRTLGNGVQTLNTNTDIVLYTYYMVDGNLKVRGNPATTPYNDLWTAAQMYPNRTMALDEVGYPSNPDLGGSKGDQQTFIDSIFGAWDQYCESQTSCNSPSLKYVDFQWGTDWSQDKADLYAVAPCTNTLMPQINSTTTNAATTTSNQLTFSTAPSSYFAAGDAVILDSWKTNYEEVMVISSISQDGKTWTMTTNPVYAHAAGYQVTLRSFHAPTVTPVGTTGSNTWQYYIVAEDANGNDSLASLPTSISNGNATLSATNYNAVTWSAVPSLTGLPTISQYLVYRSATGSGTPSTLGLVGTVSASANPLEFDDKGGAPTAHINATINLADFIGSLGYQTWSGDGSDKGGWKELCTDANTRGWSTRTTC